MPVKGRWRARRINPNGRRVPERGRGLRAGGGRVVIATLWPVLNVQAARTAVEFFEHLAGQPGGAMGPALMHARECSYRRYQEEKRPDISWMSYRFFGDPNKTLPAFRSEASL